MDIVGQGLDTVIVRDGTVYAFPGLGTDMSRAFCRVGDFRFPLAKSSSSVRTIASLNLLPGASMKDGVPFQANGQDIRIGKNIDPVWMLEGHDTAFFELQGRGEAVEAKFVVDGSDRIPLSAESPLLLEGCFAAHRATATVTLKLFTDDGDLISTESRNVSDAYPGGVTLAGYYVAKFRIPDHRKLGFFSLSLSLAPVSRPSEEAIPAYVFATKLSLRSPVKAADRGPVLVLGRENVQSAGELYEASISSESFTRSRSDLNATLNGVERVIHNFTEVNIRSQNDSWSSLELISDTPGIFTLYFDGVYAQTVHLSSHPLEVFFGPSRFDGQCHHISVRDSYGMVTHWQDYRLFPSSLTPYDALQRETNAPFPSYLSPAARFRYAALQKHLGEHSGLDPAVGSQLAHAHGILERGFDGLEDFRPLSFPRHETPEVSVVIPVHNKCAVTYYCLCALLLAWNKTTFEVIVVDDGSSDRTLDLPDLVDGVTFLRHEQGLGFVRACNAGAVAARGRYLLLLNNDTEPTCGWIDELLYVLRQDGVGLVGSKLLYPDGRLQEAGGIVWRTGNPWNYGRLANPWDPKYSYVRQVDYVSGAAIMLTSDLWRELGGFSAEFIPAYFEDTDLAFKVLAAGYKTCIAPQSLVFHFEGVSSGTDVSSGAKRFQEINRPKFKQKWSAKFRAYGEEGVTPDLEKDRGVVGRVLFIDYGVPRPDFDAGGYAAIQEMRLVQSLDYKVTLVPENLAYLGRYTEDLQRQGIEVVYAPFIRSVISFIEERGSEFDAFYITRFEIAERYVPIIRRLFPKARIIFNNADLHFLRLLRGGILPGVDKSARLEEVIRVRDRELSIMRDVDLVLSYNETEHAVILSHNFDATLVARCPWVVDTVGSVPSFQDRAGISFLGGFRHPPNGEAVSYFLDHVMPLLRRQLPGVAFHIYGSAMPDWIKRRAGEDVVAEGFIEDANQAYDRHRVFVAPLLSGAGIKGKVLGAVARGAPSVLSPIAAEGIGLRHGYDVRIASDPAEWAEAIRVLYEDQATWEKFSLRSREFVREHYSFTEGRKLMRKALEAVELYAA